MYLGKVNVPGKNVTLLGYFKKAEYLSITQEILEKIYLN